MGTLELIEMTPGVQGGYPVIAGTRTPVRTIVGMYYGPYDQDIEAIQQGLPHLSVEQIEAAIAYYEQSPDLVDEDIERQRIASEAFLAK